METIESPRHRNILTGENSRFQTKSPTSAKRWQIWATGEVGHRPRDMWATSQKMADMGHGDVGHQPAWTFQALSIRHCVPDGTKLLSLASLSKRSFRPGYLLYKRARNGKDILAYVNCHLRGNTCFSWT